MSLSTSKLRQEFENDILFRKRAGELASPFATGIKVETARLPDGRGGGAPEGGGGGCDDAFCDTIRVLRGGVCPDGGGGGCDDAFWDTLRVLRGGVCPDGGGGATLRLAGELVRMCGDSLAEAALGRVGRSGGAGAVGVEGTSPPPGVLRGGIVGATREGGADDTGLVGGGGGGTLPGTTADPDPFRAGKAGGRGTLRAGGAGTAANGVDVACD
jgi:hypothetical protein